MVALFEICFRSLFFDVKKRRQSSEVKIISWDLLSQSFSIEMLLSYIVTGISWRLTSNCLVSREINRKIALFACVHGYLTFPYGVDRGSDSRRDKSFGDQDLRIFCRHSQVNNCFTISSASLSDGMSLVPIWKTIWSSLLRVTDLICSSMHFIFTSCHDLT